MDNHALEVFLREALTQCHFAIQAAFACNRALSALRDPLLPRNMSTFFHQESFRSAHSLLTHASNVSRLFWPSPPRQKDGEDDQTYNARVESTPRVVRAKALRATIGLPDDGHHLKSRRLRDHLDHFDERLDNWNSTSTRRNIVSDLIGDPAMIQGIDDGDRMRALNPTKGEFHFRGEAFSLNDIATGINDVASKLQTYPSFARHNGA